MGALDVYGGSAKVVATLAEINRVSWQLMLADQALAEQLDWSDYLDQPISRIGLALEAPEIRRKISELQTACLAASESYFSTEAQNLAEFENLFALSAPVAATAVLVAANLAGFLPDKAVVVDLPKLQNTRPVAPNSIEVFAKNLRQTESFGLSHIRIDSFNHAAGKIHVVYVPGTQTINLLPGKNPFDVGSNLRAMAHPGFAASERAISQALTAAVKPSERVIFVGHSQGGLIAANLASKSQHFRTVGLVTFGSPIAQLANSLQTPTIAVEHKNDPVPKLSLRPNPNHENWVTVQREHRFDANDSVNDLVEVHAMNSYQQTASQIDTWQLSDDQASESGLARLKNQVLEQVSSAEQGESRYFKLQQQTD